MNVEKIAEIDELVEKALQGDTLAIAKAISFVERGDPRAHELLERIHPHTGKAYYVGITGPPGAGKSTLVDRLTRKFCQEGYSIGIIAVDPSSPFSGGSILGDRIRMNIKKKPGWDIFFRSMSSRNIVGGLAPTTREASRILDACGKQVIIIETVGVGQSELDIAGAADTVVVVMVPESGDSVQIMKAGLMEIADIFVVNKSDRGGAELIAEAISNMLERRASFRKLEWIPEVVVTAAMRNRGIDKLYEGIMRHREFLAEGNRLERKRKSQIKDEVRRLVERDISRIVRDYLDEQEDLDRIVEEVWEHKKDPERAAYEIVGRIEKRMIAGSTSDRS